MLLHLSDVLHETPRPDFRKHINTMHPSWAKEDGGYDWVDEPFFTFDSSDNDVDSDDADGWRPSRLRTASVTRMVE